MLSEIRLYEMVSYTSRQHDDWCRHWQGEISLTREQNEWQFKHTIAVGLNVFDLMVSSLLFLVVNFCICVVNSLVTSILDKNPEVKPATSGAKGYFSRKMFLLYIFCTSVGVLFAS